MKNSTLARKPGHDMKANASLVKPVRGASQSGDGQDFAFNGQMGDGINGHGTNGRYAGNYHSGHSNDGRDVNFGRGPTTGNHGSSIAAGTTPPINARTGMIDGGATCRPFGNPTKINLGLGPRKGNEQ